MAANLEAKINQHGWIVQRWFTTEGVDPFDEVEWERRTARITGSKGEVVFEQKDVEVPKFWSQNATNIVASKYFRGQLGTPQREWTVKQLISRVVNTITGWGIKDGYFESEKEAETFAAELKHLLLHQKAAFNSPVWFNIGVPGEPQQASACFILSIQDTMESILEWYKTEGLIFKGGSGSGVNLSPLRSSKEPLSSGGMASGPVSFMRGADAIAGTIKSGGKTRRAAKMVVLNVDHPDIVDFIWCKAKEEKKAYVLGAAGYDMSLNGEAWISIQYQNANNSVRVTDDFMRAVLEDKDWHLKAVTTGEVLETHKARDLMRQIAQAAWECADPGIQYDTTINDWHTCPNSGRINASNPCFPGDARVFTDKGLIPFRELINRVNRGERFRVYTHRATAKEPGEGVVLSSPSQFMITGINDVYRLRFDNGAEIRCTEHHRFFTRNRGMVPARELTSEDQVILNDAPALPEFADWTIPVSAHLEDYRPKGGHRKLMNLPAKWTSEFAELLGHLTGDGSIGETLVAWVYGSAEGRKELLPRHRTLLESILGSVSHCVQANGTEQLRVARGPFLRYLLALGFKPVRASEKRVPWVIFQAPAEIAAAYLRGLFNAGGCIHEGRNGTPYIGLVSTSLGFLQDVQKLLLSFGIASRIYPCEKSEKSSFHYTCKNGTAVTSTSDGPSYDLRISGMSLKGFYEVIGFSLLHKQQALAKVVADHDFYNVETTARLVEMKYDGQAITYNLTEPLHRSYIVDGFVVANCSEYMSLDDSSCNLASLNLMRFLDERGEFDIESFKHAVATMILAQEIIVGNASYPTEKIRQNTINFRQLGLGYANLGALLMARGLPYDSDEGRAFAAAVTALMTGHAYATSALIAKKVGPFAGYKENEEPMLRVMRKHREALKGVDTRLVPPPLYEAAVQAWDEAIRLGELYGYRNAQATVLAPTGTISFMMDCDTTGIEPDLALVKYKTLVGGGVMKIVNQTVPLALMRLGYAPDQIEAIVRYVDEKGTIEGAPHLKPEHLPVFDCAFRPPNGTRSIHYMGHVKMLAAVQPFISGAISKCITGGTLLPTVDGLVRIRSLHRGEGPDTFRDHVLEVSSLGGTQKSDAFYYGGYRAVREIVLRSGHKIAGTPNHRVLVATPEGLRWRRLDELKPGEYVAVQYGTDLWSVLPMRFDDFKPSDPYGTQKPVRIPDEMTEELAFLLGAYAAEGHVTRSNWTVKITNSVDLVLERVAAAWASVFGVEARIEKRPDRCPEVVVTSKTVVEFLDYLGCGERASTKRIPDAVLRSPREMVLAFLQGLFLDGYVTQMGRSPKVGICLDSSGMLDDLQAVLTNLGIVHSRIGKRNHKNGKTYDEVYVTGEHAKKLLRLVPFTEPKKATHARALLEVDGLRESTADIVPYLDSLELYERIPIGRSGHKGRGTSLRPRFSYLRDPRTRHVSRAMLERVAALPGVALPEWAEVVLRNNLHFSPVASVRDAGEQEVYDLSVPLTHAFVGNGIVNHNTVNLPHDVTVDEVMDLYIEGWRLGLKALAIYRDRSKKVQPLATAKEERQAGPQPIRRRLPDERQALTHKFSVGGQEGYITVGLFEDGTPGEVFLTIAKEGSTISGLMDVIATQTSLALQYGVPLKDLVRKFINTRFEPAGVTNNPQIRFATSIIDYVFRWLGLKFLPHEDLVELGLVVKEAEEGALRPVPEVSIPVKPGQNGRVAHIDGPPCFECGAIMVRTGSCYGCLNCGATRGCS